MPEYVKKLSDNAMPIILYYILEFENYFMWADGYVWFDNLEQYHKLYAGSRS